ncbi:helix-turn-helix transcriptional regulator [Microbacterium sp. 1P06AB]|uniref:helix-turn-helix transcriptional regulator n=1 Tax=Microbacterium sp. 1P06AB TaxID=3132289 RepID=UPI0039A716A3
MSTDHEPRVIDVTREALDVDAAATLLRQVAAGASIRESDDAFSLRQRIVGDERLQVTRFQTTGFLHSHIDIRGYVGVARLDDGGLRAESNGARVDVDAPFLLGPGSAETWSSAVNAEVVGIGLPALGAFTGMDLGSHGRFPHSCALTPDLQRHWESTITHVGRIFDDAALLHNDLIRQAAVDAVFAATISTFGIDADAEKAAVGSRAVHRATAFIDDNLGDPLSVADIAAAAKLSVRGLQSAFQRALGVTPATYVRAQRLQAVRRDLVASDADATTVAEVARRWGFAHLPRFAQHYRVEFGEQPHATLRR